MAEMKYRGTGVALVTPFTDEGAVDYNALEANTDRLISDGIDYLVVLGTTAETPTLSKNEKLDIIKAVKSSNAGRLPMVVGAGGNSTGEVISWMDELDSEGIDAYLSVAPYYNKPSQKGMKQHFSAIAASSDLPIILYNVPSRTGSSISPELVLELAHEYEGKVVAVKEASGDFAQLMAILRDQPEGFHLISGDDAITLPMCSLGSSGVISVIGNAYPKEFSSMVQAALSGNYETARELHYKMLPLISAIFKEGNPTGVKALMEILGYGKANLRLPLIPASKDLEQELGKLLLT